VVHESVDEAVRACEAEGEVVATPPKPLAPWTPPGLVDGVMRVALDVGRGAKVGPTLLIQDMGGGSARFEADFKDGKYMMATFSNLDQMERTLIEALEVVRAAQSRRRHGGNPRPLHGECASRFEPLP